MTIREQVPPLRVVRGFRDEQGTLVVHLHNLSGGVLGGDNLVLRFDIGVGTSVLLTTASATRIYRTAAPRQPALTRMIVNVSRNALLEYVPDSLIPFAGSRSLQETTISMASGAGLIWWEIIAPGREARGEVFSYDQLEWKFDLTVNGLLTAAERVRLQPVVTPANSIVRFGPYRYWAVIYICREGVRAERWRELEERFSKLADLLGRDSGSYWGVSALPAHGIKISGLAMRGPDAISALKQFWACAKSELYGRPAVPPRKTY